MTNILTCTLQHGNSYASLSAWTSLPTRFHALSITNVHLSIVLKLFISRLSYIVSMFTFYFFSFVSLSVLFCSLAVLDPRVGHTMDVLSPFISVLCHSDWLFHRESCPRLDVVHPDRVWSSSPACTWHCSLHYLFLQATPMLFSGQAFCLFSYSTPWFCAAQSSFYAEAVASQIIRKLLIIIVSRQNMNFINYKPQTMKHRRTERHCGYTVRPSKHEPV